MKWLLISNSIDSSLGHLQSNLKKIEIEANKGLSFVVILGFLGSLINRD